MKTTHEYHGMRSEGHARVNVVSSDLGIAVRPLRHHVQHSPDGFQWGYAGSGPAELARCMLWDHFGKEPEPRVYQTFKAEMIAPINDDEFTITGAQIDEWYRRNFPEPVAP